MEKVKILVVDDEEAIGNVIKDYLEAQGYEVFWAEDDSPPWTHSTLQTLTSLFWT